MYETFFHFTERPFAASPRIDRYYPGQAAESVRLAAARCIERSDGFAVILGASGTGKTLLCQVLAEQFRNTLTPLQLAAGQIASRKALFQAILFELGLPFRRRDEGELRLALLDRLAPERDASGGLLLLIDEAQSLRPRLFEELRLLSNVVRQGKPRVRLVLAGTAALEERLSHPKLASFQQRIVARCALRTFAAAETQEYVRAQTAVVGGDPDAIWEDSALQAIHATTDGVPRLINQVCDHALLLAAAAGMKLLGARGIEVAWADLQQLPLPEPAAQRSTTQSDHAGSHESVIEFGSLTDDLESTTQKALGAIQAAVELDAPVRARGDSNLSRPDLADELDAISESDQVLAETEKSDSPADDDAVYDDFPIVASRRSNTDVVLPDGEIEQAIQSDTDSDADVSDWVPVPMAPMSAANETPADDGLDLVLPDPTAHGMKPLRTFAAGPFESQPVILDSGYGEALASHPAEATDVVTEEEIPVPTYDPELYVRPAVHAAVAAMATSKPASNASSAFLRQPKFAQLFSTMRQRQVE